MHGMGLSIQVVGATDQDLSWVKQVSEQLNEHGFDVNDLSERDEEGRRRPIWDDDPARHRRRHRVFTLPADDDQGGQDD